MQMYRKIPIPVEAKKWAGGRDDELLDWLRDGGCDYTYHAGLSRISVPAEPLAPSLRIRTLAGVMEVTPGDWVIKGVAGEFYPCRGDVFESTYDVVED